MRGVMIAGTHSGCGKTTITLGILAALRQKGFLVQPFKAGPDFIDSGLHRMITGRPSRNLDIWMCGEEYVKECFAKHSADTDIAVVEGVMGLYDGSRSSAAVASLLGIPVVLVVDGYGMAETAGAVVNGIRDWGLGIGKSASPRPPAPNPSFLGVIFNRVATDAHYRRLRESVVHMPVLGYLPRDQHFEIPHRHLGLTTAEEVPIPKEHMDRLADAVLQHIQIEQMVQSAASNPASSSPQNGRLAGTAADGLRTGRNGNRRVRIAVAYDKAFCFYYEDNLDLLRSAGADPVFFSPREDDALPADISGIYIGGGYPELHAAELSRNSSMLASLKAWALAGKPLYAECGGLMYLSKGIHDFAGRFFRMADIFGFETRMKKGRSRLGYRIAVLKEDCIIGKAGMEVRGHEFHYSEIIEGKGYPAAGYALHDGNGQYLHDEGYRCGNALASYVHVHFGSNPAIAGEFVNSCDNER